MLAHFGLFCNLGRARGTPPVRLPRGALPSRRLRPLLLGLAWGERWAGSAACWRPYDDGQPDWLIHDTPGPKARTEYAACMRQPGAVVAAAAALAAPGETAHEDLVATVLRESPAAIPPLPPAVSTPHVVVPAVRDQAASLDPLHEVLPRTASPAPPAAATAPPADTLLAQAQTLITAFSQRFHRLAQVTPHPKELAQAAEILAQHGAATAQLLLAFAHQEAPATRDTPQVFGGILPYLPRALAAYETRATQAATQRAVADERTQREQYQVWEQRELAQPRAARPLAELAALEAVARARLVAAGTPAVALPLAVRVEVDKVLAVQAGLPTFEGWRASQEAGR